MAETGKGVEIRERGIKKKKPTRGKTGMGIPKARQGSQQCHCGWRIANRVVPEGLVVTREQRPYEVQGQAV